MLHICHITPGLGCGGAENTLHRMVTSLDRRQFRHTVISLKDAGYFGPILTEAMIGVRTLNIGTETDWLTGIWELSQLLRREQPDVVQTWMYLGDLLGSAGAMLAGQHRLIWNVRHANLSSQANKFHTIAAAHLCALAGKFLPKKIVFCSEESRRLHEGIGYSRKKGVLIENGVDTERFQPNTAARRQIRNELNISPDAPVIGLIARFDPLKDHATFIRAAAIIARSEPDVCFLLCGRDVTPANAELWQQITQTGYQDRFHLIGLRSDVPALMAAIDIACSSSLSESFPNTVAEAMSSGAPCVATDVGASARIIGDCGTVVPPQDPTALAQALLAALALGPDGCLSLGASARQRILQHFDQSTTAAQYAALYSQVAGLSAARAAHPVEVPLP